MSSGTERAYHHGGLRASLVAHGVALLADVGVKGFSVARLAKRAGVSAAAPYRHFPDRQGLLAACATVIARDLAATLDAAARAADGDPVEAFAAVVGAHARFVIERGVGLDLIFAAGFDDPRFVELHEQARRVTDVQIAAAEAATTARGFPALAELAQAAAALAHGYATMQLTGGFAQLHQGVEEIELRAAAAARSLVRGAADGRRAPAG